MDWTLPQPGESEGKARKRRAKIKSLLVKASQACVDRMSALAELRNKRDRCSSNKRLEFREAINTLRLQCREMWDFLGGFCERGA